MKFFLIVLLIFLINKLEAQVNLVPNYSFEEADAGWTDCGSNIHSTITADNFDSRIKDWKSARMNVAWYCVYDCVPSVDWMSYSHSCPNLPSPQMTDKLIFMGSGNSYHEGIRVELTNILLPQHKYTLKFKHYNSDNAILWVYISNKGEDWQKSKSNTEKIVIPLNNVTQWTEQTHYITTSDYTDLQNLVIVSGEKSIWLDDVYLYDSSCETDLLIENRQYNNQGVKELFEGKIIKSGYDVGSNLTNGDVDVKTSANVDYKATDEIALLQGFSVEDGAEFSAYIAQCGSSCPQAIANTGFYTEACGHNPVTFGGTPIYGLTYNWTCTSNNSNNAYLSNTAIANPVFTPPSGIGEITYTLTVSNGCGGTVSAGHTVSYDDTPNSNPYVSYLAWIVTNGSQSGAIAAEINNYNSHTAEIVISVSDNSNNTLVFQDYVNNVGRDYPGVPTINYSTYPKTFDPCKSYLVQMYSVNYCDDNKISASSDLTLGTSSNQAVTISSVPNVFTPNGDLQNDELCFDVTGVTDFEVTVVDRWGMPVYVGSGSVSGNHPCVWDGQVNQTFSTGCSNNYVSNGTYYYVVTFSNCYNSENVTNFISSFGGCNHPSMRPMPDSISSVNDHNVDKDISQNSRKAAPSRTQEQSRIKHEELSFKSSTISTQLKFSIIPNPNNGKFTVNYANPKEQTVTLIVSDILGHTVYRNLHKNTSIAVQIEDLSKGVYIVSLVSPDGEFRDKIVVNE